MKDMVQLLELMERPAFLVRDGCVAAANAAARSRGIQAGMPESQLLVCPPEEEASHQTVPLCFGAEASVTKLECGWLYTLESEEAESGFRALALASQTLRDPLGNAMALADELPDTIGDAPALRRELYRLLRIVGNMAPHPALRLEMQDVGAVLGELAEAVRPACEHRGVTLSYSEPPMPVYSCIDTQLLIRAVHNLLSNGLKYAPAGSRLHLELKSRGRTYQIILLDQGSSPLPLSDPFSHSSREPGTGDGREGLGLGLRLVRQAASAHGGTVLLDHPAQGGLRVTMTLPLRQDSPLRSPRLRVSYTGERDALLVELSDVLPPKFYR